MPYHPEFVPGPIGAATQAVAVTPSDATIYDPPLRRLWVGGTGNVVVRFDGTADAAAVTYTAVPAGEYLDVVVDKVMAATTATNIVGER